MKVVNSIREIYEDRLPLYIKLKEYVDDSLTRHKKERWHYESRVKNLNSFCLKAETGRFPKLSELEDFFAASIVVENSLQISEAIALIEKQYTISYRRPKCSSLTHKRPEQFAFDDIRLYVLISDDDSRQPKGVENILFEVQIKTFLQHAWSIATHDLIYKGGEPSWPTSRIAFQVKAMLEHAEVSIMEHEKLSQSELLAKTNKDFTAQHDICLYLNTKWESDSLPDDINRLSENIYNLIKNFRLDWKNVEEICDNSEYVGNSPKKNISPYSAIVLSILADDPSNVNNLKRQKVFLPSEAFGLLPQATQDQISSFIIMAE